MCWHTLLSVLTFALFQLLKMAPVATGADNVVTEDGRQKNRMEAYTKFWQDDMNKEKDVDTNNRLSSYTEVVNGTHLFAR